MKRKYYLRGLGFGILITSLVFAFVKPAELSDEEVIKRAEQLGYIKADEQSDSLGIRDLLHEDKTKDEVHTVILPELSATPSPKPQPTKAPKQPEPTPTEEPTIEPTVEPTPEPTATPTPKPTETPVPTEEPVITVITATVVVEPGNTATVVCEKIEAAGIVESGYLLRDYLVAYNLADYINIGSYILSSDMSLEEIADIITER